MPTTVATTTQTYWKDCWAPSDTVNLTLRSNGEESVQVYTTARTLVPAVIPTPTVAATLADGGSSGGLAAGNYVYLYVYASTAYPSVEADTTAGGFEWPKGQPSPVSLVYANTANHKINVTVSTSQRADIDRILIYRNDDPTITNLTYAQIVGQAGQVFYVGFVENNPAVATITFTDAVQSLQEEMEVDNFGAPQFWKCEYIDPYWYGIGNPDLAVPVTIDSSGGLTATTNAFFSGRNGQLVTFDGINTGGFDGVGTFYYLYNTATVCYVSVSADLSSQDFPGYVGTTTMRVRGFSGTLYRSKARNPFAWGYTQYQTAGNSQVRVTQQFAQEIGGYGVAIAVLPVNRQLKIDMERPSRCYAIDVSVPLESNFQQATRLLDSRYIVTAHDSQFPCLVGGTGTALRGFDTSNFAIVQSDSNDQAPISDDVFQTLRTEITANNAGRQFHGVYDPETELSAFWFKQSNDPQNLITIDSCLLYHGPSGQWSFLRDLDVTASLSVYDPVALQNLTLIGTANGQICQAFVPGVFTNQLSPSVLASNPQQYRMLVTQPAQYTQYTVQVTAAGVVNSGTYFDLNRDPINIDRFVFIVINGGVAPPTTAPANTTLRIVLIPTAQQNAPSAWANLLRVEMASIGYTSVSLVSTTVTATAPIDGALPAFNAQTAPVTITQSAPTTQTGQLVLSFGYVGGGAPSGVVGNWIALYDSNGQNEQWARITNFNYTTNAWFNPYTLTVSPFTTASPPVGFNAVLGLIDCEAQTYFQPSDTVSGQRVELWSTRENSDAANQWCRLYAEFDSTLYGNPFQLSPTKRGDNVTLSDNWETGNKVPTSLMAQFGIRFIERGYGDFTMLSFTLFGK